MSVATSVCAASGLAHTPIALASNPFTSAATPLARPTTPITACSAPSTSAATPLATPTTPVTVCSAPSTSAATPLATPTTPVTACSGPTTNASPPAFSDTSADVSARTTPISFIESNERASTFPLASRISNWVSNASEVLSMSNQTSDPPYP